VYAHIFFSMAGAPHDPDAAQYKPTSVIYKLQQLNRYLPRPKLNVRKNLLSGEYVDARVTSELEASAVTDAADKERMVKELKRMPIEYVSYWQPSLNLRLVHDHSVYPSAGIPAQIVEHMRIDPLSKGYYPVVYIDRFWSTKASLLQINASRTELPLELAYSPIALWKWLMQTQMEQSWKMQESWGMAREGESDEVKRMLTETDPWLLGVTALVSILHSVFDFLAFKNDVAFWRNNKSTKGISVRTIFINTLMQTVIFLYLLDNETSYMILVSSGVGLLIGAQCVCLSVIQAFRRPRAEKVIVFVLPRASFRRAHTQRRGRSIAPPMSRLAGAGGDRGCASPTSSRRHRV
jgi:hypothetical protein